MNQTENQTGKKSIRMRVFEIIQIGNKSDTPSRVFDIILVIVILLNIALMVLQTFDRFSVWHRVLFWAELFTVLFFLMEYVLRIWTAPYLYPDLPAGKAVLKYVFSFDGIIELLTILPFLFLDGFVVFRMLRVVRIFHLFRVNANYDSFNVILSVLYEKRNQLTSSVFIILTLILASSILMYNVEHPAQPEVFRNAFSGIWWSVSAVLTIGYGDIYPVTLMGRVMAVVMSFLGVAAVALPTGIISAGFVEQYTKMVGDKGGEGPAMSAAHTLLIDVDSAWIGLTSDELLEKYRTAVVYVERGRRTFFPDQAYNVQVGDVMMICKVPENTKPMSL